MFLWKDRRDIELNVLQETFRVLKSNIMFRGREKNIKSITITSCAPGEGKTTIALNLAVSLACSDIKTLLIDADFRKKKRSWLVKNDNEQPYRRIDFRNEVPIELVKETSIKNLYYLSLGSSLSNPELLIDSEQFKKFIDELSQSFNTIIIDAPPLGGVIDGAIIAAYTDAAVLAIQSGLHDYRTVLKAKEQLEMANVRLLGAVLSRACRSSFKSYYKYQKYYKNLKLTETLQMEQLGLINENNVAQMEFSR